MPLLRRPSRWLDATAVAGLLLAPGLALATPAPALGSDPALSSPLRDLNQQVADARAASDAAEATLDAAKHVLTPGHLLDPLPPSLMAGLGEFQAEYAEMERKVAGYRATLGDQHPTLKGAEEVLDALRGQIVEGAQHAVAAAQQDATRARATVASLERQARAADATASIAKAAPLPRPAASLPAREPTARPASEARPAEPMPDESSNAAPSAPHTARPWTAAASLVIAHAVRLALQHPWAGAATGCLAASAGLSLLVALFRPRRRRTPAPLLMRIEPAAPIDTVPAATPVAARPTTAPCPAPALVPVLATLPLQARDDPATIRARLDRGADTALARQAASVVATLLAATGPQHPLSVVVTPAAGTPEAQAQAAALALASAATAAGRRVLLVDASSGGRLGPALAPDTAAAASVAVGGRLRDLLRVSLAGRVLAVLGGDAAAATTGRPAPRLPSLDGFDAIVIAGEPGCGEIVAARFALLVAPRGADAGVLAVAARIAAGETGRPCGLLAIEPVEAPVAAIPEAPRQPDTFPSRRRTGPETATARIGLRRTFDPVRRTATRAG